MRFSWITCCRHTHISFLVHRLSNMSNPVEETQSLLDGVDAQDDWRLAPNNDGDGHGNSEPAVKGGKRFTVCVCILCAFL